MSTQRPLGTAFPMEAEKTRAFSKNPSSPFAKHTWSAHFLCPCLLEKPSTDPGTETELMCQTDMPLFVHVPGDPRMAGPTRVSIRTNHPLEKEGFEVINEFMFIISILLTSINFSENILQKHESMGENKDVWISIHREKPSQKEMVPHELRIP